MAVHNPADLTDLEVVRTQIDGLGVLEETGGTLTTDGTEQDVYRNNGPAGVFVPNGVMIDFTNQTATETCVVKVYYRITSGGNLLEEDSVTYDGVVDPPLIFVELHRNRFGVQVTIEKTGGTNRAYLWNVVYEV